MGWLGKRLNELEKRQERILIQLKRLDEIVTKRRVMRELTDVKIRIRNLHKNYKKALDDSECVVAEIDVITIADEDDDFDPTLVELNTTRPQMRMYPTSPLPHSQPLWPRVARVYRGWPTAPLTKQLGQFTGVEEEEDGLQWQCQGVESQCSQELTSFDYPGSLTEVKQISQSVEDTRAEDLAVLHGDDGGSRIDSKDLAKIKTLFSLDEIATSAGQFPCCSEIITDSSGGGEDFMKRERDGEVFTKIKCRIGEKTINKVKALVTQNTKDNSKLFLKPDASIPCKSGARSVTVVQRISKSEVSYNIGRQEEERNRRTPGPESSAKMVTVRARLASPAPFHLNEKVSTAHSESLKKRLISKVDG